jgi:hypothetical protein
VTSSWSVFIQPSRRPCVPTYRASLVFTNGRPPILRRCSRISSGTPSRPHVTVGHSDSHVNCWISLHQLAEIGAVALKKPYWYSMADRLAQATQRTGLAMADQAVSRSIHDQEFSHLENVQTDPEAHRLTPIQRVRKLCLWGQNDWDSQLMVRCRLCGAVSPLPTLHRAWRHLSLYWQYCPHFIVHGDTCRYIGSTAHTSSCMATPVAILAEHCAWRHLSLYWQNTVHGDTCRYTGSTAHTLLRMATPVAILAEHYAWRHLSLYWRKTAMPLTLLQLLQATSSVCSQTMQDRSRQHTERAQSAVDCASLDRTGYLNIALLHGPNSTDGRCQRANHPSTRTAVTSIDIYIFFL